MVEQGVRVGRVVDISAKGSVVVSLGGRPVLVIASAGRFYALDNRCPHMGFPLQQGTICDGILTCNWHHARFDLSSGGTLDPFADDAAAFAVEVHDGDVFVAEQPRRQPDASTVLARIGEGLRQNLGLVLAKSALQLQERGISSATALAEAARFGCSHRESGWAMGMTILTALANVMPVLQEQDRPLALYHGLVRVAQDSSGQPPLIRQRPLAGASVSMDSLGQWLRNCVEVRDELGAQRIVLTALQAGGSAAELQHMMFAAATDHVYLSGGHTLDFLNKAFELLEHIGWQRADIVLPSVLIPICRGARSEEAASWRQPIDLIDLIAEAKTHVPSVMGSDMATADDLVPLLLGNDPRASLAALTERLTAGSAPAAVATSLAYAASLRLLRFPVTNEFGDWISVLHTFTYCNALAQALRRAPTQALTRGLLHGAMAVYRDRFLNVPPAHAPNPTAPSDDFASSFLMLLDQQQQVDPAARMVAARAPREDDMVLQSFGRAVLREDADFHTYQALEAAIQQHRLRRGTEAGGQILMAAARYIAAHAPTARAMERTFDIARRLQLGQALYDEVDAPA